MKLGSLLVHNISFIVYELDIYIFHSPSYVFIFTYLLTYFSNILFKFYV